MPIAIQELPGLRFGSEISKLARLFEVRSAASPVNSGDAVLCAQYSGDF
jgi:hypothetical protein